MVPGRYEQTITDEDLKAPPFPMEYLLASMQNLGLGQFVNCVDLCLCKVFIMCGKGSISENSVGGAHVKTLF